MSVTLWIDDRRASPAREASLFECAESIDVRVPTSCRKQGRCRECLVEVEEGADLLSPKSDEELHLTGRFRLACRTRVVAESGTVRCHTLRRSGMRIEEGSTLLELEAGALDPPVRREGPWILLDGEPLAKCEHAAHGVAVDLGTTTVVMRLYNLETGKRVASQAFENPQRFGGSDVMARIQYDTDTRGRLLQRTLLGYLRRAIERFQCPPESIFEVVVAGNTTMRDLFFGLSVHSVGQKPYRSLTEHELLEGKRATTSLAVSARKLRLPIHPQGRVYGLPLIGSHVGADAAAGLLATGLGTTPGIRALMDIGTNTELIVGNDRRLLAASCPAGPAFEGGAIACGMPGLEGAIERVGIRDDGSVDVTVIGGAPAAGICGSGMIDLLSELLRTERMNAQGRFEDEIERFLVEPTRTVFFTERDINELAQAKGANVAGLKIVLQQYGVHPDDVEHLYLAGGFARHLDLAAARRIGLIPDWPLEKVSQVGNAAIEGASLALRSATRRRELEKLVRRVEHVELETHPGFFECFVEGCQFEPFDIRWS